VKCVRRLALLPALVSVGVVIVKADGKGRVGASGEIKDMRIMHSRHFPSWSSVGVGCPSQGAPCLGVGGGVPWRSAWVRRVVGIGDHTRTLPRVAAGVGVLRGGGGGRSGAEQVEAWQGSRAVALRRGEGDEGRGQ